MIETVNYDDKNLDFFETMRRLFSAKSLFAFLKCVHVIDELFPFQVKMSKKF